MSNLAILEKMENHTVLTIDSREVAKMIGKEHKEILRDIRNYIGYFSESKIALAEFFLESTYFDAQNKKRPNYQITKKGCEFIAHKLTGQKGAIFTATYINKFHKMERELQRPRDSYIIEDPIERAKAWIKEQQEKQILLLESKKKDQIIGELKPKADYTDRILKNKGLVTITQIAKDYGMSGQAMNAILKDLRVQYKQSGQWLLYREHQSRGYTHSETIDIVRSDGRSDITMNTKWTQKGRLFLYDLLKEHGILPIIEQENYAG